MADKTTADKLRNMARFYWGPGHTGYDLMIKAADELDALMHNEIEVDRDGLVYVVDDPDIPGGYLTIDAALARLVERRRGAVLKTAKTRCRTCRGRGRINIPMDAVLDGRLHGDCCPDCVGLGRIDTVDGEG